MVDVVRVFVRFWPGRYLHVFAICFVSLGWPRAVLCGWEALRVMQISILNYVWLRARCPGDISFCYNELSGFVWRSWIESEQQSRPIIPTGSGVHPEAKLRKHLPGALALLATELPHPPST